MYVWVCVFGYRVNVVVMGNLIVACVYIQFHGTFDRITGFLFRHILAGRHEENGFPRPARDKWFLIPWHRARACNWYTYGDRNSSIRLCFPFFFPFIIIIFFITLSLSKPPRRRRTRENRTYYFIPPEESPENHTDRVVH